MTSTSKSLLSKTTCWDRSSGSRFLGNPEFACDLQPIDFAGIAIACGGAGYTVQEPSECAAVLQEAFAQHGLALVEAVVDPNDPPLLPEIRFEHAKHMVEALARGTTAAKDIARKIAKNTIEEIT
jgi:pyruvate dehydrogenase (quinone)